MVVIIIILMRSMLNVDVYNSKSDIVKPNRIRVPPSVYYRKAPSPEVGCPVPRVAVRCLLNLRSGANIKGDGDMLSTSIRGEKIIQGNVFGEDQENLGAQVNIHPSIFGSKDAAVVSGGRVRDRRCRDPGDHDWMMEGAPMLGSSGNGQGY